MCEWGDTVELPVTIPAEISHTGAARAAVVGVDRCIAPIVAALNAAGCDTVASCCGHGRGPTCIALADGRHVMLLPPPGNLDELGELWWGVLRLANSIYAVSVRHGSAQGADEEEAVKAIVAAQARVAEHARKSGE